MMLTQCLTEFPIKQNDIFRLNKCLQLPENIAYSQYIYIYIYIYITDMVPQFACNPTKLCLIFNEVLDFILQHHGEETKMMEFTFSAALSLTKLP